MPDDATNPLFVDLYELTMVDAYRREGMDRLTSTFSLFVRDLPPGRGYLVAAGLDDALSWLESLHFDDEDLERLARLDLFDPAYLDWLRDFRFTGTVRAVPEGTIVFADEPILEVDAPLAEAQVAETFLLNQITLQSNLATKAARCRHAAADRTVVDFALRRTQGIDAGMKLARVGRIVGLAATSNVAGADRYGLPVSGTMAHAYVQAHPDERESFVAFGRAFGDATILLVDTYDTVAGVALAIDAARTLRDEGIEVRGIRLDSGDLADLAHRSRAMLDDAGFENMSIFASGGLDEFAVADLVGGGAPIDGFGIGTSLGVSRDAPALDSVYKLVAVDGRAVRKTSTGKATWPGAKQVFRGEGPHDVLGLADEQPPQDHEPLLEVVMDGGERTPAGSVDLDRAHERFERGWSLLPEAVLRLGDPETVTAEPSAALVELTDRVDQRLAR